MLATVPFLTGPFRKIASSPTSPRCIRPRRRVLPRQVRLHGRLEAEVMALPGLMMPLRRLQIWMRLSRSRESLFPLGCARPYIQSPLDPPIRCTTKPLTVRHVTASACSGGRCRAPRPLTTCFSSATHRSLYKAKPCTEYAEGRCTWGEECHFAHVMGEDVFLLLGKYWLADVRPASLI